MPTYRNDGDEILVIHGESFEPDENQAIGWEVDHPDLTKVSDWPPAVVTKMMFGDSQNYSEFKPDGRLHFTGDARPNKLSVFSSDFLFPTHHNPLEITEISGIASSITVGASNKIDVLGYNGGINVKGRLKNLTFSAVDTTTESSIIMIHLFADNAAGWSNATQWRITLTIVSGSVTGDFTVYMPPFNLEKGDTIEGFVASDGAIYLKRTRGCSFDCSVAGSEYASENMKNNESADSNVVVEVEDTTGFYVGNLTNISDDDNNEVSRIKAVDPNTSITVDALSNSYTTAKNAKLEVIDYVRTTLMRPAQRGLLRTNILKAGINSGVVFEYGIPHTIDSTEDIGIVLQYITMQDNGTSQNVRLRAQYLIKGVGEFVPESVQYGTLIFATWSPPAIKTNGIVAVGVIPAAVHAGKHILSIRFTRMGTDVIDTYTGDVKIIAMILTSKDIRLGYEAP